MNEKDLSLGKNNIFDEYNSESQTETNLIKKKRTRKTKNPLENKNRKGDPSLQIQELFQEQDAGKIVVNLKDNIIDQIIKNEENNDKFVYEKENQNDEERNDKSEISKIEKSDNSNLEDDADKMESESPIKKPRKKRRTKEEQDGRSYLCDVCGKAYFSYPAMTNHKKTKHVPVLNPESLNQSDKKSRGRPKKLNQTAEYILEYENNIKNFFLKCEKRKPVPVQALGDNTKAPQNNLGIESLNRKLKEIKSRVVNKLNAFFQQHEQADSSKNKINCNYPYKSFTDHPILSQVILNEETETDNISSNNLKIIDETLIAFLRNSIAKTNLEYLENLMYYICLFRESINKVNKERDTTCTDDYTKNETSEGIPEFCNHFIKFLASRNFFSEKLENNHEKSEATSAVQINQENILNEEVNLENENSSPIDDSSFSEKIDMIEFIQFFSYWCLTNNYTSGKLNLIFK